MNETGGEANQHPCNNSTHQAPHNREPPYQYQVAEGEYGGDYFHVSVVQN